jgi:hypothetical protein
MYEPRTFDEYVDLVQQAVYEAEEIRASVEWDPEDLELYAPYLDKLTEQLKGLYADMIGGRYQFDRNHDLPFMPLVQSFGSNMPLKNLLAQINKTHRKGL